MKWEPRHWAQTADTKRKSGKQTLCDSGERMHLPLWSRQRDRLWFPSILWIQHGSSGSTEDRGTCWVALWVCSRLSPDRRQLHRWNSLGSFRLITRERRGQKGQSKSYKGAHWPLCTPGWQSHKVTARERRHRHGAWGGELFYHQHVVILALSHAPSSASPSLHPSYFWIHFKVNYRGLYAFLSRLRYLNAIN